MTPARRLRSALSVALGAAALLAVMAVRAEPAVPAGVAATLEQLGVTPSAVAETPLDGLYEVSIGARVVYLSADGRYLLRGDLIDVPGARNLTEERRKGARRELVEALGAESMIVFEPPAPKHTVTIFTDVDCGYCARLHRQMDELLALGIRVRYLAFPRAGVPSPTYTKMVSVWCAADPHTAMTDAKAGRRVAAQTCDSPVAAHYGVGGALGVRGTPTIVLEDGQVIPGYLPPGELLKTIEGG